MSTTRIHLAAIAWAMALLLLAGVPLASQQAWADGGQLAAGGMATVDTQAKSKVYPTKKAAKKAVIAKAKAKWKKAKGKAKVENAATKKDMVKLQKDAYKEYRKKAGKNAKKYKYYFVTFVAPKFTVSAKYRDPHGDVKTYSFTASYNARSTKRADGDKVIYLTWWPPGFVDEKGSCSLYAVRKGSGVSRFYFYYEEGHPELTGKKVRNTQSGDFGSKYYYEPLLSGKSYFKLKG